MRHPVRLCVLLVAAFAGARQHEHAAGHDISLAGAWRFHLDGDSGPERRDFDDSAWSTVNVPHNGQEISSELPASTRPVWYRKRFDLESVPAGHRVVLALSGASRVQAWVNGAEAGRSSGSRRSLRADVTRLVRPGTNLVVLRTIVPGIPAPVRL